GRSKEMSFLYPCVSVFIRGGRFLCLFLLAVVFLPSCFGLDKDMGLTEVPDVQAREGAGGTLENPAPLDPFQRYDLVLAANECRVFSMKVPAKWSWGISLTVANREDARRGKLTAEIQ